MKKQLVRFIVLVSVLLLVLFAVIVMNQTHQAVRLASGVHPVLGHLLLGILLLVYALILLTPLYLFVALPRALRPPEDTASPEYESYLKKLAQKLKKNPHIPEMPVETVEEIESALKVLEMRSDEMIRSAATMVFLSTAVSQSGKLDGLFVLAAQGKMVWQVARVYSQRPSLPELLGLYVNVAATTFVAAEIDDVDVARLIEPVLGGILKGSVVSAVPGMNMVAHVITNSILSGAANAYLTLRVGVITRNYCGLLVREERRAIRRSATIEAGRMLSSIVLKSAGRVSGAILEAAKSRLKRKPRDGEEGSGAGQEL